MDWEVWGAGPHSWRGEELLIPHQTLLLGQAVPDSPQNEPVCAPGMADAAPRTALLSPPALVLTPQDMGVPWPYGGGCSSPSAMGSAGVGGGGGKRGRCPGGSAPAVPSSHSIRSRRLCDITPQTPGEGGGGTAMTPLLPPCPPPEEASVQCKTNQSLLLMSHPQPPKSSKALRTGRGDPARVRGDPTGTWGGPRHITACPWHR